MSLLIKNGIVVTAEGESKADILVDGESIVAVGENLQADGAEAVDAEGKYVLPGGVDQHVHF